jgi:hypothetical protein
MSLYYTIYHSLILIAFILSVVAFTTLNKSFGFIMLLLAATLVIELLAEFMPRYDYPITSFLWIFHIFVIIEFILLSLYYYNTPGSKTKWRIQWITVVFIICSILISTFVYEFNEFPGININLSGIFLFALYTHLLFNLDYRANLPLYLVADLWIGVGVLFFFGGTFVFNGTYILLNKLATARAKELFSIINSSLNLVLYSCIVIGLICSLIAKKYTTP